MADATGKVTTKAMDKATVEAIAHLGQGDVKGDG